MAGDEPGSNLSTGDKLIANLLYNFGWMILLVGLELIAQALVIGAQILNYWAEAGVIIAGTTLLAASYLWPPSKPETKEFFTKLLSPIAARSRSLALAAVVTLWAILMFQVAALRSDLEMYVIPRQLSVQQAKDLTAYLSAHGPYSVTVRADPSDREALQYAGAIFSAIHQSDWTSDFNLTNDDPRPLNEGLSIYEIGSSSKPSDPKHDPAAALRDAFQSAEILVNGGGSTGAGTYKLFIMVGRRPIAVGQQPRILMRLGRWLMQMGVNFR